MAKLPVASLKAGERIARAFAVAHTAKLGTRQVAMLAAICATPNATPSVIAQDIRASRVQMSRDTDTLVLSGHILALRDDIDTRSIRLIATKKGKDLIRSIDRQLSGIIRGASPY